MLTASSRHVAWLVDTAARARFLLTLMALVLGLAGCGGGGGDGGSSGGGGNPGNNGVAVPVTTSTGTASNGSGYTLKVFSLPATDLAWDSVRQALYVAVPSGSSINPNTVSLLDTAGAKITAQQSVGESPLRLALTSDGQFLFVGLSASGNVRRLTLPSLQASLTLTLETSPSGPSYYAIQIAPMPGNANTVAIVQGDRGSSTRGIGGIAIYDDAVRRTNVLHGETIDAIAWSQDGSMIYGTNVESSSLDFFGLAIAPDGVSLATKTAIGFTSSAINISMVGGLLYANGGGVLEPTEARPVGEFAEEGSGLLVPPDSTSRIAFALFSDFGSSDPNDNFVLQSYDADTYTPIASIRISGVHADLDGFPTAFVRTGNGGLAFATAGGRLFTVEGAFVTSSSPDTVAAPTVTTVASDVSAGGAAYILNKLNIAANDIAWDAARANLRLSIPSFSRFNPNSITSFDPRTGQFTGALHAGSEPNAMAISDDRTYLYVGADGASSVRRLRLADEALDTEIYLGRDPLFGAFLAESVAVAPGSPRTVAVVRSRPLGGSPELDGVAIYDDAVRRPNLAGNLTSIVVPGGNVGYLNGPLTDAVVWGADTSALYGTNNETSSGDFSIYDVDAEGPHYIRNAAFTDPSKHLHFWNGRIYTDYGQVLDIGSDSIAATINLGFGDATNTAFAYVVTDVDLRKLFYLEVTYPYFNSSVVYRFVTFDLDTYAPIDSVVYGDFTSDNPRLEVMRFVRWGTDGLAFINRKGELYTLSGAFVNGRP